MTSCRRYALCLLLHALSGCGGSPASSGDGGASTSADDGGSTNADGGGSTSADDGGSTSADDGGSTNADDGGSTNTDDGGSTRADGGASTRADGGARPRGTSFSSTPARFTVPPSGLPDGFFAGGYGVGARGWLVVDLDGDGLPDLVQTSDSGNPNGRVWSDLQGAYWRVFRGTGAGFATTATRWAVPDSGLADGFFSAYYGYDTRFWTLLDLDGDGRPELVQTADSARAGGYVWRDAQGPYWKVWSSGAGGFPAAPRRWAVPDSGQSDGFFSAYYTDDTRCWSLVDLDGDGRMDLVQTANPALSGGIVWSDATGAYWKAWAGGASGFASSSRRVAVPASGLSDGFFATTYQSAAPGTRFWTLLDLDGDRRPDLVQTADPAHSGGFVWSDTQGPSWKVFRGSAAGFGAASRLPVGASELSDGFFASAYTAPPSAQGERYWLTVDLDGDGLPELVQTGDPAHPGGFVRTDAQGAYWRVWHLGGAAPATPSRWSVPASGLSDGFFAAYWTDGGNGQRAWFLADLDGDGRLDLVHTADPTRTGLYVFTDAQGAYWKVYRGL